MARSGECSIGCGACCRFLTINVNPDYYRSEDARKWVELHGIKVRMTKGGICWMDIPLACSALQSDGKCSLHGTPEYPKGCESFPTSQAEIDSVHEFVGEEVCTYSFERTPME